MKQNKKYPSIRPKSISASVVTAPAIAGNIFTQKEESPFLYYKVGRYLHQNTDGFGQDLIDNIGRYAEYEVCKGRKRKLTEVDTFAFFLASCSYLNRSNFLLGNTRVIFDEDGIRTDDAVRTIKVSIDDLVMAGYGRKTDKKTGKVKRPSTENRRAMEHLIRILSNATVRVFDPVTGTPERIYLCREIGISDEAVPKYTLVLHSLFTAYLNNNFFLLPADIMDTMCNRIDRISSEHIRLLLKLASSRGRNQSVSYTMDDMAESLDLVEYRKKNPKQAEERIQNLCESMVSINLAKSITYTQDIASGRVTRITFVLDRSFVNYGGKGNKRLDTGTNRDVNNNENDTETGAGAGAELIPNE